MNFNQIKMNQITGISFDALFDNVSMGIIITDHHGVIVMTNIFVQKQFGYSAAEMSGQRIEMLIPSRFREKHVHHVEHYDAHPKNRPMGIGMDLYATRKDGSEFPVEVSLGSYETTQGRFVTAFVSDITRRKEAEIALKQLNEELEIKISERTQSLTESVKQLAKLITETDAKDAELIRVNAFLKSIWSHARAIIFVTDPDGKIVMLNAAAERHLGYAPDELIGVADPTILYQKDNIGSHEGLNRDFSGIKRNADADLHNDIELNYVRKDGTSFPVSLTVTPITNSSGHVEGYLGIATDVSERKKAEDDLRAALDKEKDLSELKSRFVSMASHEFRTPLSTVLSSAYLISKYTQAEDNPKREKHVDRIVSSVNMLTDILNDFLSVGKMEEGKIQVRPSQFNASDTIKNIIADLKGLVKQGQRIIYEHHGHDEVFLDQRMLKHIVINLCSNAIKFSPENTDINIVTTRDDQGMRMSVKDRGLGISEEDSQHLFERFFRGGNVTNIQGTGLGLHIVSKYVELMNGTISCKSSLGAGTEFMINFKF